MRRRSRRPGIRPGSPGSPPGPRQTPRRPNRARRWRPRWRSARSWRTCEPRAPHRRCPGSASASSACSRSRCQLAAINAGNSVAADRWPRRDSVGCASKLVQLAQHLQVLVGVDQIARPGSARRQSRPSQALVKPGAGRPRVFLGFLDELGEQAATALTSRSRASLRWIRTSAAPTAARRCRCRLEQRRVHASSMARIRRAAELRVVQRAVDPSRSPRSAAISRSRCRPSGRQHGLPRRLAARAAGGRKLSARASFDADDALLAPADISTSTVAAS